MSVNRLKGQKLPRYIQRKAKTHKRRKHRAKLSGAFRSYPHLGHGLGQLLTLHGSSIVIGGKSCGTGAQDLRRYKQRISLYVGMLQMKLAFGCSRHEHHNKGSSQ